ncbi:MAG: hypothetical protein ACK56F_08630, partial [bacterium]
VRVKGQRLAKAWMDKAVDSIERARKCVGLRFRGMSELDGLRQCHHKGRPWRAGPVRFKRGPPLDELTVPGGRDPGVSKSSATD